jgi:hypothetical protein
VAIWYIIFDTLFPVLVCCTKENLATLGHKTMRERRYLHLNVESQNVESQNAESQNSKSQNLGSKNAKMSKIKKY